MNTSTTNTRYINSLKADRNKRLCRYLSGVLAAITLVVSGIGYADDTEIYLEETNLPAEQKRPNVVFILDNSGSMGQVIDSTPYNASSPPEGNPNANGGAGDPDYVYLYFRPGNNWLGSYNPYVYVNKVHINQMSCDISGVTGAGDTTPYTGSTDRFVFGDPATVSGSTPGGNFQAMCAEYDPSCTFVAASNGPMVDCRSENNYVANSYFPSSNYRNNLYIVSSNYHNWLQKRFRSSVMQTAARELVNSQYDINLALMDFNNNAGGKVFQEAFLATDTSRIAAVNNAISRMDFDSYTPLTETLWEALRYLRGESVEYGTASVPAAVTNSGGTNYYNSPIEYACQESHIVLLTDGAPTYDNGRDTIINNLTPYATNCASPSGTGNVSNACLDDLASWIYGDAGGDYNGSYSGFTGIYTRGTEAGHQRDHVDNTRSDASTGLMIGAQTIQVHTVAFGSDTDAALLEATATQGGGIYRTASTATELGDAFRNILALVDFESDTNVTPAVAVNAYSGLQHRDELYFALFKPQASPRWYGNIKKYKLLNGDIVAHGDVLAIDDDTGFFYTNGVRSFWSAEPDNDNITAGGAAALLPNAANRNMYTYTGPAPVHTGSTAPTAVSLNETLNLNASNGTVNSTISAMPSLLGPSVTTTARAREIIDWVRGGNNDPNMFFPDVIHNPPIAVTYETDRDCLEADPPPTDIADCFVDTLYVGTNMGTLHAIDTVNGNERWSFVPRELLPNLTAYYDQAGGFTNKYYGLDGKMQVWRHDEPDENGRQDGTINAADDDHVYIYQPMRRGGTQLYAFDVTEPDAPELMWQIVGTGLDATPGSDAYGDLAQTWSSPQRSRINWCSGTCRPRDVLFFGGGYDPIHDNATAPVSSSKGNAIYMVDAHTSELLWSAGDGNHHTLNDSRLTNSFAADVTVGDVDGDGFIDLLYAVDIQGNVWRFDFNNNAALGLDPLGTNRIRGGLVAELGGSGSEFRRFYNAPDIAFFSPRGRQPFLSVSIASGHRASPRETQINDYLFVFFDAYATTHPNSYTWASGNSTIHFTSTGSTDLGAAGSPTAQGWYLPLAGVGEKGLSRTITFNGVILMTTYLPESSNTCIGTTGSGRFYMLNALTGVTTLPDTSANAQPGDTVPYSLLGGTGIPPEPVLIFGKGEQTCTGNCDGEEDERELVDTTKITACVGTECFSTPVTYSATRAYWREN